MGKTDRRISFSGDQPHIVGGDHRTVFDLDVLSYEVYSRICCGGVFELCAIGDIDQNIVAVSAGRESKRGRLCGGKMAMNGIGTVFGAILKLDEVRRGDMKVSGDINVCPVSEHNPIGVKKIKIGMTSGSDLECAVDVGGFFAGYPGDDVIDEVRRVLSKRNGLARTNIEFFEALKNIVAGSGPHILRDLYIRTGQGLGSAEMSGSPHRSIGHDAAIGQQSTATHQQWD